MKAQQFKFYVDSNGRLMMKYRILCINLIGFQKKVDELNCREKTKKKEPCEELAPLSMQPIKNLEEISRGISRFMKY